jgi:hypothetical protein
MFSRLQVPLILVGRNVVLRHVGRREPPEGS